MAFDPNATNSVQPVVIDQAGTPDALDCVSTTVCVSVDNAGDEAKLSKKRKTVVVGSGSARLSAGKMR